MQAFFDLTPDELRALCVARGMPGYVADQLLDWVYRKGETRLDHMSNISTGNRRCLAEAIQFTTSSYVAHQEASDGTRKLLLAWPEARCEDDGVPSPVDPLHVQSNLSARQTECVMIPTASRRTACVSSQVGCPVGCRFCASGLGGLEGNLTSGQIVEQVHRLRGLDGVDRISNVVFMGMGEPLANLNAVTKAIRTLNADWGFGIGARRITVSTVGLPAAIRKLASFEIPITLALSLHAPTDELRRELIPWAEYAPIDALLDACEEYFQATGREITLEYLLLRKVNDRVSHATALAMLARRLRANVNLIRYNEVRSLPYDRPTTADVHAFQAELKRHAVSAHLRASRGRDIAAACGQLRHERRTPSSS